MRELVPALAIAAVLGSAVVAGVFFAFSNFIMKALARLPASGGVPAMQEINVVVINPGFLGLFAGTAVISLGLGVVAVLDWGTPTASFYLGGAALYVVGTFMVTGVRNVPLNNELAEISLDDPEAPDVWGRYLRAWTFWNHVRTIAALAAALLYCLGLVSEAAPPPPGIG